MRTRANAALSHRVRFSNGFLRSFREHPALSVRLRADLSYSNAACITEGRAARECMIQLEHPGQCDRARVRLACDAFLPSQIQNLQPASSGPQLRPDASRQSSTTARRTWKTRESTAPRASDSAITSHARLSQRRGTRRGGIEAWRGRVACYCRKVYV